jgi:hypothetical protein
MRLLLPLAVTLAACSAVAAGPPALGTKPGYLTEIATSVPNEAAIGKRIFVPGLDDGFVPQGLAVVGDHILVSSYKPTPGLSANAGPCRVYRVEAATGKAAGQFDLPIDSCNSHAGGLADLGDGHVLLADTQMLSRIDLAKALTAGSAVGAISTVRIGGALRGSLAASDGKDAWIGTWSKDKDKSFMYRLPPTFFADTAGVAKEDRALATLAIPVEAQGAAFDKAGNVWVSASRSNTMSKLYRLDRAGKVLAEHDMPIGLEGLAFDASGKLWAMTESGTQKYLRWGPQFNFPFVFEIDTAKLK